MTAVTRPKRPVPVLCYACGRKFSTRSMSPTCPKCGGSHVGPRVYRCPPVTDTYLRLLKALPARVRRTLRREEFDPAFRLERERRTRGK